MDILLKRQQGQKNEESVRQGFNEYMKQMCSRNLESSIEELDDKQRLSNIEFNSYAAKLRRSIH